MASFRFNHFGSAQLRILDASKELPIDPSVSLNRHQALCLVVDKAALYFESQQDSLRRLIAPDIDFDVKTEHRGAADRFLTYRAVMLVHIPGGGRFLFQSLNILTKWSSRVDTIEFQNLIHAYLLEDTGVTTTEIDTWFDLCNLDGVEGLVQMISPEHTMCSPQGGYIPSNYLAS